MAANWPPGELTQSLTYREAFVPVASTGRLIRHLTSGAPQPVRTAVGIGWALVWLTTAGAVAVVVVVLLVQVVRWLA